MGWEAFWKLAVQIAAGIALAGVISRMLSVVGLH